MEAQECSPMETEYNSRPDPLQFESLLTGSTKSDEVGLHSDQQTGQETRRIFLKVDRPPDMPDGIEESLNGPGQGKEK
jgi:hypothetical protein